MQKIVLFLVVVFITCSAQAQKMDASKVPAAVKTSFDKKYPGVTAKWELEDGAYEAGFKKDGQSMAATFKKDGTFMESEVSIKVTELPVKVMSYMKEHYKGITVKEGAKITKSGGEVNYEAEIKGKDVIFDANGKFIKEAKD